MKQNLNDHQLCRLLIMTTTLYWNDYETWGIDPARDRAAQFAGIRTDTDLNIIGKPLVQYCKPADDMLPHPEACLLTGITPQTAFAEGVCEAEFMAEIHREFIQPGTCSVGYNSLRFDDEFSRYGFYRNFFDPYAREWQHGNSRWDLIDMVRLTHALRPDGIQWPKREDGTVSFRLEDLTGINGISHEGAHDALSDVLATIDLAKLIRRQQPRLYEYIFSMRDKKKVSKLLQTEPVVLHVSSKFSAASGCIAPVTVLCAHPKIANQVIVYNLRHDPAPLLQLSVEELTIRLFSRSDDLPEGIERLPVKTIHINKCPVVVPVNTLTVEACEKWKISLRQAEAYREQLMADGSFAEKLQEIYAGKRFDAVSDPDQNLYGGGFFADSDRRKMDDLRDMTAKKLAHTRMQFQDPRLPEMLFRYRARNWPQSLSREERVQWDRYRRNRLTGKDGMSSITLKEYQKKLAEKTVAATEDRERKILSRLADWPAEIAL